MCGYERESLALLIALGANAVRTVRACEFAADGAGAMREVIASQFLAVRTDTVGIVLATGLEADRANTLGKMLAAKLHIIRVERVEFRHPLNICRRQNLYFEFLRSRHGSLLAELLAVLFNWRALRSSGGSQTIVGRAFLGQFCPFLQWEPHGFKLRASLWKQCDGGHRGTC